jgi:hypothetical protein
MFHTEIYNNVKRPKFSKLEKTGYPIFISVVLIILGDIVGLYSSNQKLDLFIVIAFFAFIFSKLYCFFSEEEHEKELIGEIKIDNRAITWANQIIEWNKIDKIDFTYDDYKYKYINQYKGGLKKNRSAGINNELIVVTLNGERFSGNMFLSSQDEIDRLRIKLWEVIKANKLPIENARKIVKPKNNEENQKLKKYCR